MNKRARKKQITIERARGVNYANTMGIQGDYSSYAGGNSVTIPVSILTKMLQNLAPQKNQAQDFAPGSPLRPYQGVVPLGGPRQWSYNVGINLNNNDRTMGNPDIPGFEQLRSFAMLYSGISLCERVILDMIPKLEPKVGLRKDLAEAGAQEQDYQPQIKRWRQLLENPSPSQQLDIHSWIRMAWTEQTQIDALAIYKHKNRGGGLYGLEIIDGASMKPILDERGMVPLASQGFPAYQQYPYGVPGDLYTTDTMLYYRESPRAFTPYGFSRVERIIVEVNQALRKKRKDLARYTEGNVPSGIMEVPDNAQWTPDQIDAYEMAWNSLLAGNPQQQVRVRFTQPGMKYTRIDDIELNTPFDVFLLNTTVGCYGLSMGDIGFTEEIHKSSGDSQQNMMFRRTLAPLISVYARMLTKVFCEAFGDDELEISFGGYEEAEDLQTQAAAYNQFAQFGAISPSSVARLMKFPDVPETGPFIMTKTGPIFLEDLANPTMRKAAQQAQLAGYQLAAQGQQPGQDDQETQQEGDDSDEETSEDDESTPAGGQKAARTPPKRGQKGDTEQAIARMEARIDALLARLESSPLPAASTTPRLERAESDRPEVLQQHSGMMLAFMLDPATASQLTLPGGEPVDNLHVTLAFLGDKNEVMLDLERLKQEIADFATEAAPLKGTTGGLGRFTPSESSDNASPVIALVNVPGLQAWRAALVERLERIGVAVANDFDYTPHITLAYIDADAPLPVESVPIVPLAFDAICLAIGDDHYYFNIGEGEKAYEQRASQSPESGQGVPGGPGRRDRQAAGGPASQSSARVAAAGAGPDAKLLSAEYRRWREKATNAVKAGKPAPAFMSELIPEPLHRAISQELARCATVDEVRTVFERAKNQVVGDSGEWQQGDPAIAAQLEDYRARGVTHLVWRVDALACVECYRNADQIRAVGEPFPTGAYTTPQHDHCGCTVQELMQTPAPTARAVSAAPRFMSKQGSCDCGVCREMAGKPIGKRQPPYHDGCDCESVQE